MVAPNEVEKRNGSTNSVKPTDSPTTRDRTKLEPPPSPNGQDHGSVDEKPKEDAPPSKRSRLKPILIGLVVLLLIGGGVTYYVHSLGWESTDDAFIEAHVVGLSTRVAGVVETVSVNDNQHVTRGQVVATLDPRDAQASLDSAKALLSVSQSRVEAARENLSVLRAGVEQAKAAQLAAQAEADRAHDERLRVESIATGGASPQELSTVRQRDEVARAQVESAKASVSAAEAQLKQGNATIATAQAEVTQAQTTVAQRELDLSYMQVVAPETGRVTRKSVEPGQHVDVGQSLLAIVPDDAWVVANFKETQLDRMKPGQPVEISVDAYPGRVFKGHIDSIQAGTGSRFSLLPPENATGNFVKIVQRVPVKIVLDERPQDVVLGPGMSVEPSVKVK